MSDIPETPPTSATPAGTAAGVTHDDRQLAFIVYILYLAHFVPFIGWAAALVGLVLAYVERDRAPAWLRSHYTFQIRTFWIGLLYYIASIVFICTIIGMIIGIPGLIATGVWFIVRCALGISRLLRNEPYPTPESWTV